ncbi:hypothetical protein J4401_07335 [Candidatus Woesearchaeota archaeon]|nr:hypothetical protein [Candidatus Woesearchaeota archaeon]
MKTNSISKISEHNYKRISSLKVSGYEPNNYIISLALDNLERNKKILLGAKGTRRSLPITTRISHKNMQRISKLKITGYETNDYVIGLGLDLLEKNGKK